MRKEYDLKKLKKRLKINKPNTQATKTPISLRIDSIVLADIKTEAHRQGIAYQTLIGSILHCYTRGELIDRKITKLSNRA